MVVPSVGELLFSVMFSYMGALEFFFIARNLYHWGFKHHKHMVELANDPDSLNELQEKIKNAIKEAKEKEVYGYNAMKDGVLYQDGFRVSLDNDTNTNERQVIGSSRNSIEKNKNESEIIESNMIKKDKNKNLPNLEEQKVNIGKHEIIEEPFVKKEIKYINTENYNEKSNEPFVDNSETNLIQSIKTQFGQSNNEQISVKSELPNIEKSSNLNLINETNKQILNSQENIPTNQKLDTPLSMPELHFSEYDRPEPDGQDVNETRQYSDEYLRSLDGIKYRPLVRDDGTGRRRAFKKRRSSGDSSSSRESRASREEEVKMFTSLEEEEFESIKRGESEYNPIRYSSDPNLKITKHSRRHKRSPIKGSKESEESRSSLEMLDEEGGNPWGDIKPEHYKNTEFWKREKTNSIEEENIEDNSSIGTEQKIQNQSLNNKVIQKCASPSPATNIPELSSFEDATPSQHENLISTLPRGFSREADSPEQIQNKNEETSNTGKSVSSYSHSDNSLPPLDANSVASAFANQNEKSFETDENFVHDQYTNEQIERQSPKLRRSPRQDDMEYYEEKFIEEERKASRTPSPQIINSQSNENETQQQDSQEKIKEGNKTISNENPRIEIDSASDLEYSDYNNESESEFEVEDPILLEGISDFYDFNASINPSRSPSRSGSRPQSRTSNRGSKSPEPIFRKSIEKKSRSISPTQTRSRSKSKTPLKFLFGKGIPGLSDWYDYNVLLNERAYGMKVENDREVYQSSTDFIVSRLKKNDDKDKNKLKPNEKQILENTFSKNISKSSEKNVSFDSNERATISNDLEQNEQTKSRSITPEILIETFKNTNEEEIIDRIKVEENKNVLHNINNTENPLKLPINENSNYESQQNILDSENEPPTPQFPRSISAEWKDTERMKEEFKRKFRRSKYIGDSIDFSDEFEELREKTRLFRRSRSKSRTPTDEDIENIMIGETEMKRKIQDKILAQITKTTLNYQEYSKDINYKFLEHERRGSDSALLKNNEFIIQFKGSESVIDEYNNYDGLNLEDEEYHHFRRFSLNQEAQIEEYPSDEYIYEYVKEIDLNKVNEDTINPSDEPNEFISLGEEEVKTSEDPVHDLFNHDDEDNQEDSDSEDERQTVVEVEDEIDEDIWDYEKPEEFNEQSECEEAEREADRYLNRSAKDWKEEGAIGGNDNLISFKNNVKNKNKTENFVNIENIYDETLQYVEIERIEKDYENIIEAMNNEEKGKSNNLDNCDDGLSIKTEDLIEEILNEDEEKYGILSPRSRSKYNDLKISSQDFINHEKGDDVPYYVTTSTVVHHNTASTRLRSRYGLPPSSTYKNYDYDDISVDLNYKPKKEYNWRKNFKIDDENNDHKNFENNASSTNLENESENANDELKKEYLDTRKYSLGGESITLYSRSCESEEKQLEIIYSENTNISETNNQFQDDEEELQSSKIFSDQNEEIYEETKLKDSVLEQASEVTSKKKKSKKKSRKGSKASLGEDDVKMINLKDTNSNEINENQTNSNSKTKTKKKKKVKVEKVVENFSPNTKSPDHELENDLTKSLSSVETKSKENESIIPETTTDLNTSREVVSKIENSSKTNSTNNNPSITTNEPLPSTSALSEPSSSPKPVDSNENKKSKPKLERNDSSGVYELIKDGSMYPWF